MNSRHFPYLALGMGLLLLTVVLGGGMIQDDGGTALPLLTLLVVNEVAFFTTAIGAYIGIRHSLSVGIRPVYMLVSASCIGLAAYFMWQGVRLWPL